MALPDLDAMITRRNAEAAAEILESLARLWEAMTETHAYAMDDADWDERRRTIAAVRSVAARTREGHSPLDILRTPKTDHGVPVILGTLKRERDWVEPVTVAGEGEWQLCSAEAGDDE